MHGTAFYSYPKNLLHVLQERCNTTRLKGSEVKRTHCVNRRGGEQLR